MKIKDLLIIGFVPRLKTQIQAYLWVFEQSNWMNTGVIFEVDTRRASLEISENQEFYLGNATLRHLSDNPVGYMSGSQR